MPNTEQASYLEIFDSHILITEEWCHWQKGSSEGIKTKSHNSNNIMNIYIYSSCSPMFIVYHPYNLASYSKNTFYTGIMQFQIFLQNSVIPHSHNITPTKIKMSDRLNKYFSKIFNLPHKLEGGPCHAISCHWSLSMPPENM